jgi:hypothetical protein
LALLLLLLQQLLLGLGLRALQQLPEGLLQIELAAAAVEMQLELAHSSSSSKGLALAGVRSMAHSAACCNALTLWRSGALQAAEVRLRKQYLIPFVVICYVCSVADHLCHAAARNKGHLLCGFIKAGFIQLSCIDTDAKFAGRYQGFYEHGEELNATRLPLLLQEACR